MGRTLIVGDVHGCAEELRDLLDRSAFGADDHLIFVGDLVARGPCSLEVLALARRLGARVVLGNHEERLLDARRAALSGQAPPRLGATHREVYEQLGDDEWRWLGTWPRRLDLPEHGVAVVHAGVVPGVALEQQDPWLLTHLRSIDADGSPTDRLRSTPWAQLYAGAPHVVFGHDALRGLQLAPCATGLDSGCVYGRTLSALVLQPGEVPLPARERARQIVQVPARRTYFAID